MIHTAKCFHIVDEAEVDVFLEFPCFLYDPTNVDNLISGSSAFSKPSLCIWKILVHVLMKTHLKNFEHYLTSMENKDNCVVIWIFFGTVLLWLEWKLTFSSPMAIAEFSKFADWLSITL